MPTFPLHQSRAASHSVISWASWLSSGPNSMPRTPLEAPVPRASAAAIT